MKNPPSLPEDVKSWLARGMHVNLETNYRCFTNLSLDPEPRNATKDWGHGFRHDFNPSTMTPFEWSNRLKWLVEETITTPKDENEANQLACMILNAEYLIVKLNATMPLRTHPFLIHWVTTAHYIHDRLKTNTPVQEVRDDSARYEEVILRARLELIHRALVGLDLEDKDKEEWPGTSLGRLSPEELLARAIAVVDGLANSNSNHPVIPYHMDLTRFVKVLDETGQILPRDLRAAYLPDSISNSRNQWSEYKSDSKPEEPQDRKSFEIKVPGAFPLEDSPEAAKVESEPIKEEPELLKYDAYPLPGLNQAPRKVSINNIGFGKTFAHALKDNAEIIKALPTRTTALPKLIKIQAESKKPLSAVTDAALMLEPAEAYHKFKTEAPNQPLADESSGPASVLSMKARSNMSKLVEIVTEENAKMKDIVDPDAQAKPDTSQNALGQLLARNTKANSKLPVSRPAKPFTLAESESVKEKQDWLKDETAKANIDYAEAILAQAGLGTAKDEFEATFNEFAKPAKSYPENPLEETRADKKLKLKNKKGKPAPIAVEPYSSSTKSTPVKSRPPSAQASPFSSTENAPATLTKAKGSLPTIDEVEMGLITDKEGTVHALTRLPLEMNSFSLLTDLLEANTLQKGGADGTHVAREFIQYILREVEKMGQPRNEDSESEQPPARTTWASMASGGIPASALSDTSNSHSEPRRRGGRDEQVRVVGYLVVFLKAIVWKDLVSNWIVEFEFEFAEVFARFLWIDAVRRFKKWLDYGPSMDDVVERGVDENSTRRLGG